MSQIVDPTELARALQDALTGFPSKCMVKSDRLLFLLEYPESHALNYDWVLNQIYQQINAAEQVTQITYVTVYGRVAGDKQPQWQKTIPLPRKASYVASVDLPGQQEDQSPSTKGASPQHATVMGDGIPFKTATRQPTLAQVKHPLVKEDPLTRVTQLTALVRYWMPHLREWLHQEVVRLCHLLRGLLRRLPALSPEGQLQKKYEQVNYWLDKQDHNRATAILRSILEQDPEQTRAFFQLGSIYAEQGFTARALQQLWTAKRLEPNFPDLNTLLARTLMPYAEGLIEQGHDTEAMTQLQMALSMGTLNKAEQASIYHQLGQLHSRQQEWEEAIGVLETAVRLDASNPDIFSAYGYALSQQGNQDKAIEIYWKALNLDNSLGYVHHRMGQALMKQGQLRVALASYRTALSFADTPKLHVDIGLALLHAGDYDMADQEFTCALDQDPSHAEAYCGQGFLHLAKQNQEQAAACYRRALELEPALMEASAGLGLAQLMAQKQWSSSGRKVVHSRQIEAALARFEQVLAQDPTAPEAQYGLGEVYRIRGNLLFAIRSYQLAVEANASYTDAHFRLGSACAVMGRYEKAISELRLTLQLNPQYPGAQDLLERVLKK